LAETSAKKSLSESEWSPRKVLVSEQSLLGLGGESKDLKSRYNQLFPTVWNRGLEHGDMEHGMNETHLGRKSEGVRICTTDLATTSKGPAIFSENFVDG
jgi:hypothetical protein